MSVDRILKAADVLEKVAAVLDEDIATKIASETTAGRAEAEALAKKWEAATGRPVAPDQLEKIAADASARQLFASMVDQTHVDPLGSPSPRPAAPPVLTKQAAVDAAYAKFAQAMQQD